MNYCSNCGSDQLKKTIPPGDNRTREVCSKCGAVHYHNPKIITGCLPVWKDRVLLCRRAIEPQKGLWNIPAGFMEIGESAERGAAREVWEEAAAKVDIRGVLAIYTSTRYAHVYILYFGELLNGQYGIGEESLETRLFAENEIPWQDIAFESSRFALRKYFEDLGLGLHRTHYGHS